MSAPRALPTRPVDYCIVISTLAPNLSQSLANNTINDTAQGVDIQPGAQAHSQSKPYPCITQRYPAIDHKDAAFPADMVMFAFPSLRFELSTKNRARETFSFALTEADGARVYASAVRWWQRADPALVKASAARERRSLCGKLEDLKAPDSTAVVPAEQPVMYAPICVVLTSHWPFFNQMERYLNSLQPFVSNSKASTGLPYPIERSLLNLIYETPLPPAGQLQVEAHPLPSITLVFARPAVNKFPLQDFSLLSIFRMLSVDNLLTVFSAVSTEKRILFTSNYLSKLTMAAECCLALIFPFYYRNIYIPILPQQLLEFSAAPMPYIMGCPLEYLPEDELLDNVLIVELDTNVVRWNPGADQSVVAPLPPHAGFGLTRSLKKLLSTDGSLPLKSTTPINEEELRLCFVRFYAKLFASYRDYLQAPTSLIVDKFDRSGFLATHEDRESQFLNDMLDTQMFGSFVDDRFTEGHHSDDAHQDPANLDVLIFDEYIDREAGKATPFLSDTSHDHQAGRKFVVPPPYFDDLASRIFTYQSFPIFDPTWLYQARTPPQLSAPTVSSHAPGSLSMKFFTHKRAYSQYLHSLRLRSSKYDLLLKDVVRYVRESARVDEEVRDKFSAMCAATIDKPSVESGASVDAAWSSLKRFVSEQSHMDAEAFAFLREETFIPLTTSTQMCELQLKLLFSEASTLDSKAAKLKSASERAKAKSVQLKQRYTSSRQSLLSDKQASRSYEKPSNSLSSKLGAGHSTPLSQVISVWNEEQEASMEHDLDEVAFHSMVVEYEARMPEIIKSIKQLNSDRLTTFKTSMKRICEARREQIAAMTTNLEAMEASVDAIDVDADIRTLSQGNSDFANAFLQRGADSGPVSSLVSAANAVTGINGIGMDDSHVSLMNDGLDSNPLSRPHSPDLTDTSQPPSRDEKASSPPIRITTSGPSPQVVTPEISRTPARARAATNEPPSPVSAPSHDHLSTTRGRPRSSSNTAFSSQPASPTIERAERTFDRSRRTKNGSLPSALPSMFKRGPSPRLGSSSSLSSLFSKSTFNLDVNIDSRNNPAAPVQSSVGITFLKYLQRLHGVDEVRERERLHARSKTTAENKAKGMTNLTELDPCYPLNLWGDHPGFDIALTQATANKRALKEFALELEQWAQTIELKKRRLEAILAQQSRSIAHGSNQQKAWDSLKARITATCAGLSEYLNTLYSSITELRLDKGEIKNAIFRFTSYKTKLDRELAHAHEEVSRALQKRTRTWSILQSVELAQTQIPSNVSQRQLESNAAAIDKAIRDFKEANYEWNLADRDRAACERKFDLCRGIILRLFEQKDKDAGLCLKRVLSRLADSYVVQCVAQWRKADEALAVNVKSASIQSDLYEFVVSTYDTNVNSAQRIAITKPVDFAVHLAHLPDNGLSAANTNLNKSVDGLRALSELFGLIADCEDNDSKALKKAMLPVRSAKNTTVVLALSAFDAWLLQQVELCDEYARLMRDSQNSVDRLRTQLRTVHKNTDKQVTDMERAFKKVQDELDKARFDEKKVDDVFQTARGRVTRAEADIAHGQPAPQRGFLGSFTTVSIDSLKTRAASAEADLQRAKVITAGKQQALNEEHKRRGVVVASVLRELQQAESTKWTSLSSVMLGLADKHRTWCDRAVLMTSMYRDRVRQIDVISDLQDFLSKNSTNLPPPISVIEMELKLKQREEFETEQKEAEIERTQRGRESLIEQSKNRSKQRSDNTDNVVVVHRLSDTLNNNTIPTADPSEAAEHMLAELTSAASQSQPPSLPSRPPKSIVARMESDDDEPENDTLHVPQERLSSSELPPLVPPPRPPRPASLTMSTVTSPLIQTQPQTIDVPRLSPLQPYIPNSVGAPSDNSPLAPHSPSKAVSHSSELDSDDDMIDFHSDNDAPETVPTIAQSTEAAEDEQSWE